MEIAGDPPEPFEQMLAERTSGLMPAETLELLCDVPDADVRTHHWCQTHHFKLLNAERQGSQWRLRILRVQGHTAPIQFVGRARH